MDARLLQEDVREQGKQPLDSIAGEHAECQHRKLLISVCDVERQAHIVEFNTLRVRPTLPERLSEAGVQPFTPSIYSSRLLHPSTTFIHSIHLLQPSTPANYIAKMPL